MFTLLDSSRQKRSMSDDRDSIDSLLQLQRLHRRSSLLVRRHREETSFVHAEPTCPSPVGKAIDLLDASTDSSRTLSLGKRARCREIRAEVSASAYENDRTGTSRVDGETIYRATGFVHCLGISDRGFNGVRGTGTLDNEANGSFRSPTFGSSG